MSSKLGVNSTNSKLKGSRAAKVVMVAEISKKVPKQALATLVVAVVGMVTCTT